MNAVGLQTNASSLWLMGGRGKRFFFPQSSNADLCLLFCMYYNSQPALLSDKLLNQQIIRFRL